MRAPYYSDESVIIYHGDCRDVLDDIDVRADLLLTDPPYGQQFSGGGATTKRANIRGDGARQGVRVVRQMLGAVGDTLAHDAHAYLFCHWESWPDFYDAATGHLDIKSSLIWHKERGGMGDLALEYARDYEVILFGVQPGSRRPLHGRRDGAVIRGHAPISSKARVHPTEKPVSLLRYLIEKSCPPGGLVLDPFAGSGPVGEAARETGRLAVLIEMDEAHCETAATRMRRLSLGDVDAVEADALRRLRQDEPTRSGPLDTGD